MRDDMAGRKANALWNMELAAPRPVDSALKALLRKKQNGEKIELPKEEKPSNIVNLLDALRKSGGDAERHKKARKPNRRAPAKRRGAGGHRRKAS
jgi:DNA end-binding protein Ku